MRGAVERPGCPLCLGTRMCVPSLHVLISGRAQGLSLAEAHNRAHLWDAMSGAGGGGGEREDEKMVGRKQVLTS